METHSLGKWLISIGIIVALAGVLLTVLPKIPWFGRLPGDILIKKENFGFYFPITTCLVISLVVTLLLHLFKR